MSEMTDLSAKDCNSNRDVRNLRNLAEKQRRDKLNGYINELANSVPLVTMSSKRLDKTSVLRLSAAYLRLNKTALNIKKHKNKKQPLNAVWRPTKFTFNHLRSLIDSVEGFIVVTTGHGKIIYVSHSVENFLGHQNIEMIGNSLTSFLHPNDIESVYEHIQKAQQQVSNGSQVSDKMSFQCRFREKNQPRSEVVTYQMVHVSGQISFTESATDSIDQNDSHCSTSDDCENKNPNNFLFKGFVQVIPTNPMAELSLMDADLDEYISRHSLDGTLLFADHRISGIIGFLPSEVYGKSAYDYILPDDHSIALFAHKLMLSNSNGTGTVVHRLRTTTGSFVFLQSSGCLQYDKNGQIDHWVCVSRLLVENEGDKEREKFVKRFTPHIYNISPTALYESLRVVIGPNGSGSGLKCDNSNNDSYSPNSVQIREIHSPEINCIETQQPLQQTNTQSQTQKMISHNSNRTECDITSSLTASSTQPLRQIQEQLQQQQQQLQHIKLQQQIVQLQQQNSQLLNKVQNTVNIDNNTCFPVPNVNHSVSKQTDVHSSGLVQIPVQTLPIYSIGSAQEVSQQNCNLQVNSLNTSSNINNMNVNIANNLINLYASTPFALNIHNSNPNANTSSAINNIPTQSVGNLNTRPANDFTHLLGATVLTFDSNQSPVLSIYSPSIASEDVSRMSQNETDVNHNHSVPINSCSSLKCSDSSDISPSMDTSFYSPIITDCDDTPQPQREHVMLNGLNFEETSNQSNNSLLSFSFPSTDSQCDLGLIEDQSFDDNLINDPIIPYNGSSDGNKRSGFNSNAPQLDGTVETEAPIFNLQNTETSHSSGFTSKRNANQF